jgi:hypothetical protein
MKKDRTLTLKVFCTCCDATCNVNISQAAFAKWKAGHTAEEAMPELSPGERTIMVTGICDICFAKILATQEKGVA